MFLKIFFLFALSLLISNQSNANALKIVTGDLPPFTGKELKNQGAITEIVTTVLKKLGRQYEIDFRPWARGYQDTKTGRFWATFPYVKSSEREKEFVYSETIYTVRPALFIKNSLKEKITLKDLGEKKLCSPIGFAINKDLLAVHPQLKDNHVRPVDLIGCVRMIQLGRADYFIINTDQGKNAIRQTKSEKSMAMVDLNLKTSDYHLIVSKNNSVGLKILEEFDRELIAMKKSGQVQKIINRHFSQRESEFHYLKLALD